MATAAKHRERSRCSYNRDKYMKNQVFGTFERYNNIALQNKNTKTFLQKVLSNFGIGGK